VRRRTAAAGGGGRAPLPPCTSGGGLMLSCSCGCAGGFVLPCFLRGRRRGCGAAAGTPATSTAAPRQAPASLPRPPSIPSEFRGRRERGGCVCGTRASPRGGSRIPSDSKETGGGWENEGGYLVPAAGEKTVSLSSRRGIPAPVRMVLGLRTEQEKNKRGATPS
jgi:hypothetical protein